MDMDLVLEEIEREDRAQRAAVYAPAPEPPGPAPVEGIAQLEAAIAALQRAREDAELARLVPDGPARLERLERDAGALLAQLLARRA